MMVRVGLTCRERVTMDVVPKLTVAEKGREEATAILGLGGDEATASLGGGSAQGRERERRAVARCKSEEDVDIA